MAARSFSNAKFLSALVDGVSVAINRRGYAVATSSVLRGGASSGMVKKQGEEKATMKERSETISWVPDPVTGYYRPENRAAEIDAVQQRDTLLSHKTRQH